MERKTEIQAKTLTSLNENASSVKIIFCIKKTKQNIFLFYAIFS